MMTCSTFLGGGFSIGGTMTGAAAGAGSRSRMHSTGAARGKSVQFQSER